ncbi:cytochrome-c peroxidase [Ramlibacter humi]|uniref:C-type cytochrome n=1 Tax=Ramlibacter humi TaxID=2530451 RepID=A0A4Z0CDX5_9BURK|nr:cytochrome c peroxidase [Ramlibacter humi]TFZ08545.1 c-type cytochrome [Ramlibacter humi]
MKKIEGGLRVAACAAAVLLGACGGGGGGGGGTPPSAPLSPQAQQFINVDMQALPDFTAQLPAHYAGTQASDNTPAGTQPSAVASTLGRVLFHDKQLSFNGRVSCASCHDVKGDFADAPRFSSGFDGGPTTAHAMRLANLRFFQAGSMFWDRRAASLEAQSTMPIAHPVEMGFDATHGGIPALVQRMQGLPYYPELFSRAFGDPEITEARMQSALAQFLRSIVSANSRWDTAFAQVFDASLPDQGINLPLSGFTDQENRGRQLFMAGRADGGQNCAACHKPPTFALAGGSNGLDAGETRRFKSPSLKNVARSGAFMHDGRFSSLEEVVEHYSTGVKDGPALDNRLRDTDGTPLRPNLPDEDKAALVAFLKTLSDPVLSQDSRYTSPFRADQASASP